MTTNLGRWERIGSIVVGAGLLYMATRYASMKRSNQVLGVSMLARGLLGRCAVKRALLGTGAERTDTRRNLGGAAGIHVRESVIVRRPVHDVYRFWRRFDSFSRFLQHVERVDVLDAQRSHWVVRGPGGLRFEWDAEIITDEPDELISWKSTEHADVVSAGSVVFRPLGPDRTQVAVHLQYAPPGGKVGRRIASVLGQDPNAQIRDDLDRLRTLLEQRGDEGPVAVATVPVPPSHQPW